jgi:serine/threonine-protein kinase
MIGKTPGYYEVLSEPGRGGMGEVAIKVLPGEFAQDAEGVARLEREARMLAALNHPNISAIYGLEQSDDTRFLVLELVEGDTLVQTTLRAPLPG